MRRHTPRALASGRSSPGGSSGPPGACCESSDSHIRGGCLGGLGRTPPGGSLGRFLRRFLGRLRGLLLLGGAVVTRRNAQLLLDLLFHLGGHVDVLPQEPPGVLLALSQLRAVVGVPGTGLTRSEERRVGHAW